MGDIHIPLCCSEVMLLDPSEERTLGGVCARSGYIRSISICRHVASLNHSTITFQCT